MNDELRAHLSCYLERSAVLLDVWNEQHPGEHSEAEWVEDFTFWYFARKHNLIIGSEVDSRVLEMAGKLPTAFCYLVTCDTFFK